ncbi:zinc finger SWIM domain-containing protein 7 isoform X1 [Sminthopsis crassicaudata]|uniref:zinc finger SWIM domain-containing protein 7 isoform X1 n=1 Tax=Sminthopsis crassicaudata TaxID=9301 RepID=UPI003D681290
MKATLPTVVEEILSEIAACGEPSRVPDKLLLALKFLFGPSAVQALDLVDRRSVTRISSPSGRTVFQVLGSSGKAYTCFTSCHYCSCPAFAFSVLRKNDSLLEGWILCPSSSPEARLASCQSWGTGVCLAHHQPWGEARASEEKGRRTFVPFP